MDSFEKFFGDTYELVDTLKKSDSSFIAAVYDKRARRLCVMKQRNLNSLPIYRTLKELNNPHVPKIYRLIERDETLIVIEEHVDGQTLEDFLLYRPNEFTEPLAEKILLQLCDCLAAVHTKKIIHRDIKPTNIMLTEKNFVKLVDFGIARIFKPERAADTELLGTRNYAPPEQFGLFAVGQTDPRSDIYSLGVTMKNLLGDDCDERLKKILDKCTALEPAHRFQSVNELRVALGRRKNFPHAKKFFAAVFVVTLAIIFFTQVIDEKPPVVEKNFVNEARNEFNLSLGKLKLGDSIATMREIFGYEDRTTPSDTPGSRHCEYKNIVVTVANDSVIGLVSYSEEIQTERGLHQGSTLDEVIAAYGQRASVYVDDGFTLYEYPYESVQGNLAVMRFAVKNNVVEYISLRFANEDREVILPNVKTI